MNDEASKEVELPEESANKAEELQSAVRKLAEKKPERIIEMMQMEMSSFGNPLHQKMNSEHISQVLDLATKHDERE